MGIAGSIVVLTILWWLCFLGSLSIGLDAKQPDAETVAGAEPGAPDNPRLRFKALVATGLAFGIYLILQILILVGIIDIPGVV